MTNIQTRLTALDIPQLQRYTVGFDRLFDNLLQRSATNGTSGGYPPYNIIRHDETEFTIELAVAGFSDTDLSISVADNELTVIGTNSREEVGEFMYRGISARDFERKFPLAEYVQVTGAKTVDGMLVISLTKVIPEAMKPRTITINAK